MLPTMAAVERTLSDVEPSGSSGESWYRLPTDTDKSYAAFLMYRDMGPTRSLTKVADALGKYLQQISLWNIRHRWTERVADYDRDQDRIWQAQVAGEKHVIARKHAQMARQIQHKVLQRLSTLSAEDLSPADVLAWARLSITVEQDVYGLRADEAGPTGNVTIVVDHRVISPPTATPAQWVDEDPASTPEL